MSSDEEVLGLLGEEIEEKHEEKSVAEMFCSSDEVHDVTCSPCLKEGRNVAAKKYCVECGNYLCDACLKQHNRFGVMQSHHVVSAGKKKSQDRMPIQMCTKHRGKHVDTYCGTHDDVCCSICAAIDHSTCQGRASVLDMVKESEDIKQKWKDLCGRIGNLEEDIQTIKATRKTKFDNFKFQKLEVERQVKGIRNMVTKHFDDLEGRLMEHIGNEVKDAKAADDSGVNTMEHVDSVLKDQRQTLERLSTMGDPASMFVQARLTNKSLTEVEGLANILKSTTVKTMHFLPDKKISKMLEENTSLGELVDDVPECSAELDRIVHVRASSENSVATISGVCSLDDGSLLILDCQNKSLKRLDENYNITENFELPNQPYDVCKVESAIVAVSCPKTKKIQFVCYDGAMELATTFSVSDACRGLAYSDGLLYVACGGWRVFKEGQGRIDIYNTSGVLQRTFGEHISQPAHISLSASQIYVADNNNGLVIMDKTGSLIANFTHRDLNNSLAVCTGPGNQLFLGGWSSHNVMLLTNEGQFLSTLLDQKRGLKNLHTLFFDDLRSRLIITMRDTDKMKVFNLDFK